MRSTSFASPTELDALTSTASPGRTIDSSASVASSTFDARSSETCRRPSRPAGASRRRSGSARSTCASSTAGARPAWSASLCSPSSRIGPSTAIRRVDIALRAEALERRGHRGRICVVAFVDQQHSPPSIRSCGARRALRARRGRRVRGRRRATSSPTASTAASTASALETQCSPRCEMVKVSSRSRSAAVIRLPPVSAATAWIGVDVGIAAAEGDDLVGMAPRRLHQPVAMRSVVRNDGDAVRLEAFEDFRLGVRDRFFRTEIFDVRGGMAVMSATWGGPAASAQRSRPDGSCPFRAPQTRRRAACARG